MADKLENIFDECLDRISRGESIESCLHSYPQEAAYLEPLLRTAMGFSWRASAIQPRPQFKAQARAQIRFQAAQLYATQVRQPQRTGLFTWQRAWAVALTAIVVLVLTAASTVAASAEALPDQPLYPVKLATEQVKVAFAVSDEKKAEVYSQLAETRAMEIATLAQQGKTEQIVATTDRLANNLEKADIAIARVERAAAQASPQPTATTGGTAATPAPPQPTTATGETQTAPSAVKAAEPSKAEATRVKKIEQLNQAMVKHNERSLAVLQKALDQAPPQAKPALQRAIQTVSEKGIRKPPYKSSTEGQNQEQEQEQEQEQNQNQGTVHKPDQSQNQVPGQTTSNQTQSQNPAQVQDQTQNQGTTQNPDQSSDKNTQTNYDKPQPTTVLPNQSQLPLPPPIQQAPKPTVLPSPSK